MLNFDLSCIMVSLSPLCFSLLFVKVPNWLQEKKSSKLKAIMKFNYCFCLGIQAQKKLLVRNQEYNNVIGNKLKHEKKSVCLRFNTVWFNYQDLSSQGQTLFFIMRERRYTIIQFEYQTQPLYNFSHCQEPCFARCNDQHGSCYVHHIVYASLPIL